MDANVAEVVDLGEGFCKVDLQLIYGQLRQLRSDWSNRYEARSDFRKAFSALPCCPIVTESSQLAYDLFVAEHKVIDVIATRLAVEIDDILRLLLDHLFTGVGGKPLQIPHILTLMEYFLVDSSAVKATKEFLFNSCDVPVNPKSGIPILSMLQDETLFGPPSVVMLSLAALYLEVEESELYEVDRIREEVCMEFETNPDALAARLDEELEIFNANYRAAIEAQDRDILELHNRQRDLDTLLESSGELLSGVRTTIDHYGVEQEKLRLKQLQEKTLDSIRSQRQDVQITMESVPEPPPVAAVPPAILPELKEGDACYCREGDAQSFTRATVRSIAPGSNGYRIVTVNPVSAPNLNVAYQGNRIAFAQPAEWILPVKSRVITPYTSPTESHSSGEQQDFRAGIVAESPSMRNRQRYLVIFDDENACYRNYTQVYRVMESREDIWEEIGGQAGSFVKLYLSRFPEQMLLRLRVGRPVVVSSSGEWRNGLCVGLDSSMAQIAIDGRNEWVFRGNRRLYPIYSQLHLMQQGGQREGFAVRRKTGRCRRYRNVVEYVGAGPGPEPDDLSNSARPQVARKSTSSQQRHGSDRQLPRPGPKLAEGTVALRKIDEITTRNPFVPHRKCSRMCLNVADDDPSKFGYENPLFIPLLLGWLREIAITDRNLRRVFYRTPCGVRLSSTRQVAKYILDTHSKLAQDNFAFEIKLIPEREFRANEGLTSHEDISRGVENVPIPMVNIHSGDHQPFIEYKRVRFGANGLHLNDDGGFVSCCECTDNCQNWQECACIQHTIQATKTSRRAREDNQARYFNRRLKKQVMTGVFECNAGCACNPTQCENRVAQRPLQKRLQLFKTAHKGWGLRTLDDIPKGGFICTYAGQVLRDEEGDKYGKEYGDEYLAELDLIETLEDHKLGRDSPTPSSSGVSSEDESEGTENSNDGSRKVKRVEGAAVVPTEEGRKNEFRKQLFHESGIYILDAKTSGNLGRYLNHSCDPNVFVQNVFVDTHDLRFPWVAFFAYKLIEAGSELCWDYNYEINSLPGRAVHCHCETSQCRGRLI